MYEGIEKCEVKGKDWRKSSRRVMAVAEPEKTQGNGKFLCLINY